MTTPLKRDREAGGGRLRRAPGAEREPTIPGRATAIDAVSVPCANRPPPKPIKATPSAEQRPRVERRREDHEGEGDNADQRAEARDAMRVRAAVEAARGQPRPTPPPIASIAVSAVVAPTGRCRILPP